METKEAIKYFQSILRLNEKLETEYLTGISFGQSILVTIVSNISTHEYCLFLLEKNFFGVSIYKIISIDENFNFNIEKKFTNNNIIWIFKGLNIKELKVTIPMKQQYYKDFKYKLEKIYEEKKNTEYYEDFSFNWLNNYKSYETDLEEKFSNITTTEENPFIHPLSSEITLNYCLSRECWVSKQLAIEQPKFIDLRKINIFIGTWNVNGKNPDCSLNEWLNSYKYKTPDIYVIGLQEMDLSKEAYIVTNNERESLWCQRIEEGINTSSKKYVKVASQQMVGICVFAFVKKELKKAISNVSTTFIGCGLMGIMGNKGASGIRMMIYDSYVCFVNSHLAADSSQVQRRNEDFKDITKSLLFPFIPPSENINNYYNGTGFNKEQFYTENMLRFNITSNKWLNNICQENLKEKENMKLNFSIFDNDILFWFGDLNYRLNNSGDAIKEYINKGKIEDLLEFDQLMIEKEKKQVFTDFYESKIHFIPTYKYDIGTNIFDTSEKKRAPAFCDRILWYKSPKALKPSEISLNKISKEDEWIIPKNYNSYRNLTISDHKPVFSEFEILVRKVNKEKYSEIYSQLIKQLDRHENDSIPVLTVSSFVIDFGKITNNISSTKSIIIKNEGKVLSSYELVTSLDHNKSKSTFPYISVKPSSNSIYPGESQTVNITLTITTETSLKNIDEIIILSVKNGNDMFLNIKSEITPSIIGIPIETLCQINQPLSYYPWDTIIELSNKKELSDKTKEILEKEEFSCIPKCLYIIIDFLMKYGRDEKYSFNNGNIIIKKYIIYCLNNNIDLDINLLLFGRSSLSDSNLSSLDRLTSLDSMDTAISSISRIEKLSLYDYRLSESKNDLTQNVYKNYSLKEVKNKISIITKKQGKLPSINSMAEVLMKFLYEFPKAVVPYEIFKKYGSKFQTLYSALPPSHANTLNYLICYIGDTISYELFSKIELGILLS
ncbi:DNase I-like protein [Anaeromyces robustus]|uniref:DNase I-like protein n=1 Tax=Anaeromyces robustus TaxID=1754192 RepID=A0A1Y1WQV0_9FUNG|nr:DNase I-like protein [Anaeromyces robustus]|eukprot:ORX75901.1 DNase I-like protein [Anaeromyces robustus]